jgi:DNA-binding SARP family transcriptional activator/streptogramin lyase
MRFSILGPLEVHDGDGPVALGGGHQRKLLAVLLVHPGEAVSGDRLIAELWGERPPGTAVKALQGYVSQLRKRLGPETVETVGSGYRLRVGADDVDARRFEAQLAEARRLERAAAAVRLREALALWRGPALSDFAYDDFARNEAHRLEELRLACIERRIDLELALGHHDDLVPELESLVRDHPLRELFRRHLMLALYRSGRQADALDAYRATQKTLREELGLEPSEELKSLERSILEHDPALAPPPRVELPRTGTGVGGPPFSGRRLRAKAVVVVGALLVAGAAAAAVVAVFSGGDARTLVVPRDSVALFDAHRARVRAFVGVGSRPVAVAVGAGGVWVANGDDGTVNRLDPTTGRLVRTIGVGADVNAIATGFGSVWVADGNDATITRIDPGVNQIERTIAPAGPPTLATSPIFFVAVDSRFVWATQGDRLLRVDPRTSQVTGSIAVGAATGLATGGGSVWVTTVSQQLIRVDPATVHPTAELALPGGSTGLVYAGGSLWTIVAGYPRSVQRLDPVTLTTSSVPVAIVDPTSLGADGATVWVADREGSVQTVNDTRSHRAVLEPSGEVTGLAAAAGRVWLTVAAAS